MGVTAKAFLEAISGNSSKTQTMFAKWSHVFKVVLACVHLSTLARKILVASERAMGRSSRFDFCPRLLAGKLPCAKVSYNPHEVAALRGMTAFPQTQCKANCQDFLYLAN